MNKTYILIAIMSFFLSINRLEAQTIWTGPVMTFTKASSADWTLAINQDRITSHVWLTRATTRGIFNILAETSYTKLLSPLDTEWAFGTTANVNTLSFNNWESTVSSNPPSMVNQNMVLHLITDNIYIDIMFTSWDSSNLGGGFSYNRSTNQVLATKELKFDNSLKIYPNPSSDIIQISGVKETVNYKIFNILGNKVQEGILNQNIKIQDLTNGIYFLQLEDGTTKKFIKL